MSINSAAFFTARKVGNKGYLIGIIVGLVSFAAVLLVSLLVSKQSIGVNTLFHLVIILISSMIGGILGINSLVKSKKYI
jgi:putative membrane protein (TIGR04086 family)